MDLEKRLAQYDKGSVQTLPFLLLLASLLLEASVHLNAQDVRRS